MTTSARRLLTVLTLSALLQACHLLPARPPAEPPASQPAADTYSSPAQRADWTDRLKGRSIVPPTVAFHPLGHLAAVAGRYPLPAVDQSAIQTWLLQHREMLGLPADATLVAMKDEAPATPGDKDRSSPHRVHRYEVAVKGIPFSGLPIRVVVSPQDGAVLSLSNGFSPPLLGFGEVKDLSEESAWVAAETFIEGRLEHLSATQTWFDPDWATRRRAGVKELHWRLHGVDPQGLDRYIFIRNSDGRVGYATSPMTAFGVHESHVDDSNDLLWDNQTFQQGCSTEPWCVGDARADSETARDVFPAVIDLWYRITSPLPGANFQWPFTGPHQGPYDNRLQSLRAVLGHTGEPCAHFPCRMGNTYFFPAGWLKPHQFGVFGHEYGHGLLQSMKVMHTGVAAGMATPPAQFSEAMADLIGIVSNYRVRQERFGVSSRFAIGEIEWHQNQGNWNWLPAPVDWELKAGSCPGYARERIGRAFYETWRKVELDLWGSAPRPNDPDHQKLFRAWWLVIMTTLADVPDFPAVEDFHAALVASQAGFFKEEARVYFTMLQQFQQLGLDGGCR